MNRIRLPSDIRAESFGLTPSAAPLAGNEAVSVFRQMLRIRLVEERIAVRYAEQEMRCPTHLCIGHEAPPAGVCAHLRPQDLVFSNHRSHGHDRVYRDRSYDRVYRDNRVDRDDRSDSSRILGRVRIERRLEIAAIAFGSNFAKSSFV